MKNISLKKAVKLLNKCHGVITAGAILFPTVYNLNGKDENEFLYLNWTMVGDDYDLKFIEKNNQTMVFDNGVLTLNDVENNEIELILLVPMTEN